VLADTQDQEIESLGKIKGFVECDAPNEFLEVFDGILTFENDNVPSSLRSF